MPIIILLWNILFTIISYSLSFVTLTTSDTLLKFSVYDFNDYDDKLLNLQIPTHDQLEKRY